MYFQLIDLKAELFRKQEEFKKQKLQNQNASVIRGKTIEKVSNISSMLKNFPLAKNCDANLNQKHIWHFLLISVMKCSKFMNIDL